MATIKLLTDSVCDIPAELREGTSIHMLPFPLIVGDKEYRDGVDITPREFYKELLEAPVIPTHAQLTPYIFEQEFEAGYEEGYADLIYVSINSAGSATFQNAEQAREEFFDNHPEAAGKFRIHLLDSHSYTMCYGWAVLQADRMIRDGAGVEAVLDYLRDWIDHVAIRFACLDLRFAKKSGRISAAAAFMGEALGLKPILTFENGKSKTLTKVRGEKAVISNLVQMMQEGRKPGTPYIIIRGNDQEQYENLLAACQATGEQPALSYDIGCVVSVNAGPNVVGVIYYQK